ncbi:TetR/AcrR family transcriptional regulator C-terminal domain-containing protein [Nocardiopsis sp. RSe5-2]|uniref:TetR/AcrR family transcriptional regulator C-terminal domain-containing protein n=1 Tax=Nocardiopsis endophytica TaxID=3018445 RepID=A0ABT4U3T3_9ACTN|nr:TetR/AcrR family transcriptional regulator C-terminal domain-containing protein [Nocardiopsis endophytica]MDA2811623.1 TetR/AcrR family transcriptional regulator C-terminal domain-containing protein [Nocardiopsis endophytica]
MNDLPAHRRIADDLRRRIGEGALRPGDRVPSTRQITRDWGVAMATATKALTALRQEGLVHAVPGRGTVVSPAARAAHRAPPGRAAPLSRERVVRAAIRIADAEGAGALTMRRIATELGVAAMSLYRHVPDKDTLMALMADAVFAENALPDPPPQGWRASLEAAARVQWQACRRHLWLTQVISFTRPVLMPHAMAHTEWMLRAVDGLGMDVTTMSRIVIMVTNHVRACAVLLGAEHQAEVDSGVTAEQWWGSADRTVGRHLASGRYPLLASFGGPDTEVLHPESVFEFGLQRLLDGLESFIRH